MCSMIFEVICCLALSCCRRKIVAFSGLTLEDWAFNIISVMMEWSELMFCLCFKKSRRIAPFLKHVAKSVVVSDSIFHDWPLSCHSLCFNNGVGISLCSAVTFHVYSSLGVHICKFGKRKFMHLHVLLAY